MHLLYCDESNLQERSGDFLIYGGLMIPSGTAEEISKHIEVLRTKFKIPKNYRLKFNPGPDCMPHVQFLDLKSQIIAMLSEYNAKLIVYMILHDIAKNSDEARRNGINTVCYHYHCLMTQMGGVGLVLIDRFNDADNVIESHLREKLSIGLTGLPYSREMRLDKILGFHYCAIGQSHFPSIIDIVLGSFRFSVNAFTRGEEKHFRISKTILDSLSPLFHRHNKETKVSELGIVFSPKILKHDKFRVKYQLLKDYLDLNGIKISREITKKDYIE